MAIPQGTINPNTAREVAGSHGNSTVKPISKLNSLLDTLTESNQQISEIISRLDDLRQRIGLDMEPNNQLEETVDTPLPDGSVNLLRYHLDILSEELSRLHRLMAILDGVA